MSEEKDEGKNTGVQEAKKCGGKIKIRGPSTGPTVRSYYPIRMATDRRFILQLLNS
jgi:hypothetical protein